MGAGLALFRRTRLKYCRCRNEIRLCAQMCGQLSTKVHQQPTMSADQPPASQRIQLREIVPNATLKALRLVDNISIILPRLGFLKNVHDTIATIEA